MPDIILYMIKVNIAIVLFYAAYRLFLYRLTFYSLNRFYLLFTLMFSVIYPFVDFSRLWMPKPITIPVSTGMAMTEWQHLPSQGSLSPIWVYILVMAGLVMLVLILRMLIRLTSLWRIHRRSHPASWFSFSYREAADPISPFSFWQHIYVHTPGHETHQLPAIFHHEQVHVRQLHSFDVLMAEIASVICWYNPLVWRYRRAIAENLEFIADRKVLENGADPRNYQYHLVHTFTQRQSHLTNSFNFKNLKNRIMMMNKKKSARYNLGKYLVIIPVVVLFVSAFTITKAYQEEKTAETGPADIAGIVESRFPADTGRKQDTKSEEVVIMLEYGKSSLQNLQKQQSSPVYIIDGKEVKETVVEALKPEDIKRIDVLKGGKAVEKYGKKSENGVIVVTLKEPAETPGKTVEIWKGERVITLYKPGTLPDSLKQDSKEMLIRIEADTSLNKTPASTDPLGSLADQKSILDDNPLIFLDGEEINSHVLGLLDKEQIKSISIFKKGAAEAAPFGPKGINNGVVLIASKKGGEGKVGKKYRIWSINPKPNG